jgi:FtsH-binding integral membrane protein
MKLNITIFLTIVCAIIIFLIYNQIKKPLSVQNYLIGTYLYIALAIAIVVSSWSFMIDYNIEPLKKFDLLKIIILCILSFGSLFVILGTNNDQILLKHTSWVVLVLTIAIMSFVFYKENIKNNTMKKVTWQLFGIVCVFSLIAHISPLDTFKNWGKPLTYALLAMIIIEMFDYLITENYNINLTSWIIIIIFCGFLLYDTQKIISDGIVITNLCQSKNQYLCADYPKESLGVFLDIVNLFQRLSIINK